MTIEFGRNNESKRTEWIKARLKDVPPGSRVLDAGAGELRNKPFCTHLEYVSQDICQYEGSGDGNALQTGQWNTSGIDIVSDIAAIPEPDGSFDCIICTEVFEHLPDPLLALGEFSRLLRAGGTLIITAPFCSLTHFAPYHYSTGLSRYWYELHLPARALRIKELSPNGGWFDYVAQELWRLPSAAGMYSAGRLMGWVALLFSLPALMALRLLKAGDRKSPELLTFGWHVVATRQPPELHADL
jgi:SAM-dependent methyltransferase